MAKPKRSFFERLTGIGNEEETVTVPLQTPTRPQAGEVLNAQKKNDWVEESAGEGELAVDVYQSGEDIIIKAMVAGVRPDNLDIAITRDMVTIKGKREASDEVSEENFFFRELYWGSFSRTILLPQEVEAEEAEAMERNGLLTIKLPRIDKGRQMKLKVKTAA